MHECDECGQYCGCDMEDHDQSQPDDCTHMCDEDDLDDDNYDDDWETQANADYIHDGMAAVRGQL